MATPGASSDTLISSPVVANSHGSSALHGMHTTVVESKGRTEPDLELAVFGNAEPVVPKVFREASDITWQESLEASKDTVTLVRRRGRFRLLHQQQFRNSLLASVGYLELANAADFAANVWNEIPVPTFAAVLMGIGGTCALCMVFVAIKDFRLSRRNVKLLRAERDNLKRLRHYRSKNPEAVQLLESRLGVSAREIGTEVVDRMAMDALLGFGSVLVGVGTLMAIGGANPRVFKASNLLSGYIGNGLAAIFGLLNAIWSGYLIHRFHQQLKAIRVSQLRHDIQRRLHHRLRQFQWHSFINGLNGLVAGAGSMVTAERWWGYVVLIPCIISLIAMNLFWRKRLGYDRPILTDASLPRMQLTPLLEDLEYVILMQRGLAESDGTFPQNSVRMGSLDSMLRFIRHNGMLERYCESLTRDKQAWRLLEHLPPPTTTPHEITISFDALSRLSSSSSQNAETIRAHVTNFLQTDGILIFTYRERHLLELLAFACWQGQTGITAQAPGAKPASREAR